MNALLSNARLLLAALWAGSVWAVSYLAAPSAFAVLDSTAAGSVVSTMLTRSAWLAIALAVLLALVVARRARPGCAPAALAAGTRGRHAGMQPGRVPGPAAGHGGDPRMAAGPAGVRVSPQWGLFMALHGVSQALYLIESVLGALLVVKAR